MQQTADELRGLVAAVLGAASRIEWSAPYGPGKWRRIEVLGHLVDSAVNNHQRFVRALIQERLDFPEYRQEECVAVQEPASMDAAELLQAWGGMNRLIAHVMERIPEAKRATPCRIGNGPETTLEFLVKDYNRHLKHHLAQIL